MSAKWSCPRCGCPEVSRRPILKSLAAVLAAPAGASGDHCDCPACGDSADHPHQSPTVRPAADLTVGFMLVATAVWMAIQFAL